MNAMRVDESTQDSASDFPVTETTLRIALRRVRDGKVRPYGGAIVDASRPVPIYVTAALRELVDHEQVRLATCSDGERFEITPAGQDLYDELRRPQTAAEPVSTPRRRFRRASPPADTQWPQLAFLLDATPPWRFTRSSGGMVVAKHRDDNSTESVWVVDTHLAGYISRPLPRHAHSTPCTLRGLLDRVATFLRASIDERST